MLLISSVLRLGNRSLSAAKVVLYKRFGLLSRLDLECILVGFRTNKIRILEIKCGAKHLCSFNIYEEESKIKVNLLSTVCAKICDKC
jgi:hypothetical protein